MSDPKDWYRTADNNSATAPNGFPEGMLRSDVNNSARELMAAIKRWYDDPTLRQPFEDYSLIRSSGTLFFLADGSIESNAGALLEVGQRVRMDSGTGLDAGKFWEGFIITTPGYTPPNTILEVVWIAADSTDTTGPQTNTCEVYVGPKDLGRAAWYDTGATAGSIPLFDDLDAHVTKAENTLDVGFLDGDTRDEIQTRTMRGRINFNGSFEIWQRGTQITGSSGFNNDNLNLAADGWCIISDGDDRCDYELSSDAPDSIYRSCELTSNSTQNFGLIHVIEQEDIQDIAAPGNTTGRLTFSFWGKFDLANSGIDRIRVYLLTPTSTLNTTVVSSWPASAGVDFTPTAGWTILASESFTLTDSWQQFTHANFTNFDPDPGGAGVGQLGIAFHVDTYPIVSTAKFLVTGFQVNQGDSVLPYDVWSPTRERQRAYRYCENTFHWTALPGPDHGRGNDEAMVTLANGTNIGLDWRFRMEKYPATGSKQGILTFNPNAAPASAGDDFRSDAGTSDHTVSSTLVGRQGAHILSTTADSGELHYIALHTFANLIGNN